MSDHEGGDVGNWEDASLPGGSAFIFRGTDSICHEVLPNANQRADRVDHQPPREPYPPQRKQDRPNRAPPTGYRPIIQGISGILHRSSGIQARKAAAPPQPEPIRSDAYQQWRDQTEPTSQYEMSVTWRMLMSNILFESWSTPDQAARQQLDEICRKTAAYIPIPDRDTNKFQIWGTQEQAEHAQRELEAWVGHVRAIGIRPSRSIWHKEKAFDGRMESRLDQREREKEMGVALRNIAEAEIDYAYHLHFQWPEDVDLIEFIKRYDMTVLREIRERTLCRIDFRVGAIPGYTICAHEEGIVKEIGLRMHNLVMEMVAQKSDFIRCSRFKLPSAPMYRDKIGWDQDPASTLYLPTMFGEALKREEIEDYEKLCRSENAKNRNLLRRSIDMCLQSLHAPGKHVRMRVTFAELGFQQYQRPPLGKDYHDFDDFCAMIPHQNVRISPLGLRSTQSELVDVLEKMAEFRPPETVYTIHFDFDSRHQSTIRLEIEYRIGIMTGELETMASRWLEFAHDAQEYEMLEVNMLDLQHLKCNYQIHIGGTTLFEPDKAGPRKQMMSFQDQTNFIPPPRGIKAPPRRRAVYPSGHPDLKRVEEITIVRYPFKDTNGVFELQRKDIYDESPGMKSATPISSVWAGKYYYPEWDGLMGDFAILEPGEQVKWARELGSFFLDSKKTNASSDFRALPKGFRTFMNEIEEIQRLIGEGIAHVEEMDTGLIGQAVHLAAGQAPPHQISSY